MSERSAFRAAVEAKDLDRVRASLAEDLVLHSPILFKGFEGREAAMVVLGHVIKVLEDFRYVDELTGDGTVTLRFKAKVGDLEIEGIDFLELDADGLVAELTVFLRPLKAVNLFNERMMARFAAAPPVAAPPL